MKKIKKAIFKYWKNDSIGLIRLTLELILVFGLITYFNYKQTDISIRQLRIQERQQQILDKQILIFDYEHRPKFQIVEYYEQKDSLHHCITEGIQIQNEGYPIDAREIEIYSFFEIDNGENVKTIFPVKLYYRIGTINRNERDVLETLSGTWNCKDFFKFRDELHTYKVSYHWALKKFHVIRIKWKDVLKKEHISYYSTDVYQPNQEINSKEALKLIKLHDQDFKIHMQKPINTELIIDKVKNTGYNKVYN
ncbi:hypothetical protein FGF1_11650 [Flavobacteriaceae bacterium GF1]